MTTLQSLAKVKVFQKEINFHSLSMRRKKCNMVNKIVHFLVIRRASV